MILRFFISLFRAHIWHFVRVAIILFLSTLAFLLTWSITYLVENIIQEETRALIGADLIIQSSLPPTDEEIHILKDIEQRYNLEVASTIDFQTNILWNNEELFLTDVKIISQNYPLIWKEIIDYESGVYVSEVLRNVLYTDQMLLIGENEFNIKWNIGSDIFWGFSLFSEGREVWIPEKIAPVDKLLWIAARAQYAYYFLVEGDNIQDLKDFFETPWTFDTWRVQDIASRQDIFSDVFWELQKFMQVFFAWIYILAFFSLFFTLEAFKRIVRRDIGLFILLWYHKTKLSIWLAIIGIIVYLIWCLFAYVGALWIISFLQNFPLSESLDLHISHIIQSFLLSFVMFFFAGIYTIREYLKANVLDLLHTSDSFQKYPFSFSVFVYIFLGISVLLIILWASLFWIITINIASFIVLFFLSLIVKTYFLFIYKIVQTYKHTYFLLYYTLRACIRPGNMTIFIVLPVMIIGTVIFFFLVFAISFLDVTRVPQENQTYFILNIKNIEKDILQDVYDEKIEIYDIILARIVRINNVPIREFIDDSPGRGEFTREFNITTHPLPDNVFTDWKSLTEQGISIDSDFAQRLWVTLWDEISFLLSGREVWFTIQNMRPPVRGDFRPFFYFQIRDADIIWLERSYFATLWDISWDTSEIRSQLFDISPRLQFLDISQTLEEIRRILAQIYQWIFAISVYVGIFVWILLSISLTVLWYIRNKESYILFMLWASKKFCKNFLIIEYLILLSFSLIWIICIGTLFSAWFFTASSFLDFKIYYILQASGIIFLIGVFLYLSILVSRK